MTIDSYSFCPCGSGKKIKFCKCKDSVGELDRVLKMIEGGQLIAALDRLNQILEEYPSAAWALAIRGRLLLDLREYKSLAENAERFVRLQPSNPIALAQKSAGELFNGNVKSATETLLQGLNETGQGVDSFVLDVASVLSLAQAQSRWLLTAQMYALLTMSAQGYDEQTASSTMEMIHGSPEVNLLMKSPPSMRERPADVEWGERYDEAAGLLTNQRMLLAEPKLESLDRQFPQQPAILDGLLLCAVWRGDVERQCELFRKLAACESLDFEERARMLAMSALADPEERGLSIPGKELTFEVEDAEQVSLECEAHPRFLHLPAEALQTGEGQVKPRNGYQLVDRDPPTGEDLPPAEEVPNVIATAFLYGRQTDRAPRVVVLLTDANKAQVDELLTPLTGGKAPVEEQPNDEALLDILQSDMPFLRFKGTQAAGSDLQRKVVADRLVERALACRLPIIDGKSLAEVADDEAYMLQRTAIMRTLENYDALLVFAADSLTELSKQLNVPVQPRIPASAEIINNLENHDLPRVDVHDAAADLAVYLLQRAKQVRCTPAILAAADRLISMEPEGELKQAKLFAYLSKVPLIPSTEKALAILDEARQWANANGQSEAPLLLAMIPQYLMSGNGEGFQTVMRDLTGKYGNDPSVMGRLQQMLVQFGLINPDGSPRVPGGGAAPAEPSGSGLWTPDQGAAPAPPAAGGQPAAGGSKLWVPGMD